jgi:hypothetical protein
LANRRGRAGSYPPGLHSFALSVPMDTVINPATLERGRCLADASEVVIMVEISNRRGVRVGLNPTDRSPKKI